MRTALAKHNPDLVAENYKYIMQITGDNDEGKRELDNFFSRHNFVDLLIIERSSVCRCSLFVSSVTPIYYSYSQNLH